jgi:Bacterial regulatory proteins, luxR family
MQLVVMRKSSKEIARELGIAKPTVDQRIASARQILGARNRDEAANMFARYGDVYDRVPYDSACIPPERPLPDMPSQETRQDIGLRLEEPSISFNGAFEYQTNVRPGFLRGQSGEISTLNRLLIIVGMTVGILSTILIGLSVAQSLSGLLTAS